MSHSIGESDQSDSIELFHALSLMWQGRWLIAIATLAFTAAFAIAAFTLTPVYRVATILVPASQERAGLGGMLSSALGSIGGLASLAGLPMGSSAQATDEALAVLRSRQFIEKFIVDRNLLPVLFDRNWDAAAGRWAVPPEKQPSLGQGVKYFLHDVLTVTQDKKTDLLTLQVEWKDRIAAADWANDLVRRLNASMRARAVTKSDASLGYLRKELEAESVVETRSAISRLIEAQINQRMISTVTDEFSFRVVDRAIPPDNGDTARPKKPLMIIFGFLVGLVVGSAAAILRRLPHKPVVRPA